MSSYPTLKAPDTGGSRDTLDRYEGSDGCFHHRLRLGRDDLSPTVRRYSENADSPLYRSYDARCNGCYFGAAHSLAYHDEAAS